jgi:hypothetical protein
MKRTVVLFSLLLFPFWASAQWSFQLTGGIGPGLEVVKEVIQMAPTRAESRGVKKTYSGYSFQAGMKAQFFISPRFGIGTGLLYQYGRAKNDDNLDLGLSYVSRRRPSKSIKIPFYLLWSPGNSHHSLFSFGLASNINLMSSVIWSPEINDDYIPFYTTLVLGYYYRVGKRFEAGISMNRDINWYCRTTHYNVPSSYGAQNILHERHFYSAQVTMNYQLFANKKRKEKDPLLKKQRLMKWLTLAEEKWSVYLSLGGGNAMEQNIRTDYPTPKSSGKRNNEGYNIPGYTFHGGLDVEYHFVPRFGLASGISYVYSRIPGEAEYEGYGFSPFKFRSEAIQIPLSLLWLPGKRHNSMFNLGVSANFGLLNNMLTLAGNDYWWHKRFIWESHFGYSRRLGDHFRVGALLTWDLNYYIKENIVTSILIPEGSQYGTPYGMAVSKRYFSTMQLTVGYRLFGSKNERRKELPKPSNH